MNNNGVSRTAPATLGVLNKHDRIRRGKIYNLLVRKTQKRHHCPPLAASCGRSPGLWTRTGPPASSAPPRGASAWRRPPGPRSSWPPPRAWWPGRPRVWGGPSHTDELHNWTTRRGLVGSRPQPIIYVRCEEGHSRDRAGAGGCS